MNGLNPAQATSTPLNALNAPQPRLNTEEQARARSIHARPSADGRYWDDLQAAVADRDDLLDAAQARSTPLSAVNTAQPRLNAEGRPQYDSNPNARTVAVIGCGHVGLVTAAGLAELGHHVIGVDIDEALVEHLNRGVVTIEEPLLQTLVYDWVVAGRLRFTTDYAEAIPTAEFVFLCVDTPQTIAGAASLGSLRSAVYSVADTLNGANPIVVNKSTSPIGTGETIEELLREALGDQHPRIVSNPEFLRQGTAVKDFMNPDRVVIGARSKNDAEETMDLYQGLQRPGMDVVLTDLRTAELIKYVSNAFLATRVSFINEIARLCEGVGADIDTVVRGVASDPRIGSAMFTPGIGYGGSCLPKDVAALRYTAEALGVATPVLSGVQEANSISKTSLVRRLRAVVGTLEGRPIGVWGLTFKGGTEDTRESPAMDVIALLVNEGAVIRAYDPAVAEAPHRVGPRFRPLLTASAIEAAEGALALVVLTDWPTFARVDMDMVRAVMAGSLVVDGRNVLSRHAVERVGLDYIGVGRGRWER